MHRDDLERLIDEKLGELSQPVAPPTLVPRVLAAIDARLARPWYQRAWRTWPPTLQAASAAGLLAVALLALALVEPVVQTLWSQRLGALQGIGSSGIAHLRALLEATEVLRRILVEPLFAYALAVGLVTGMALTALSLALTRLASLGGGVSES